jgi:carbonic anhydrase
MDIVYRFSTEAAASLKQPRSNREALKILASGNERFAQTVEHLQKMSEGKSQPPMVIPINPVQLGIPIVSGLEPAHSPFALVLGCSDARVPIEHILDCSANDLFVVRVAGNVLGLECIGSVDYAATQLRSSLQSIVVLGHRGCGAVNAAVAIYLSPNQFAEVAFSHAVRTLVDRIMLSVRKAAAALEEVHGSKVARHRLYREWLTTTSIYLNAAVTAFDLQREVNAVAKGLQVSYSIYDMGWTRIGALPIRSKDDLEDTEPFHTAPKEADDFPKLAEQVIRRLV